MFTNDSAALNGDLSDLLTHLEAVYRQRRFEDTGSPDLDSAEMFLKVAREYLTENRPSEVFAVDNNYGILLTNGQRVKICPTAANEAAVTGGDMANPDSSIPVTRQR